MLDLKLLTAFNPAIIYSFEPESTPEFLAGDQRLETGLIPEAIQHEDLLKAYLYAQDTLLPLISKPNFTKTPPQVFIDWLKTLHGLLGKTLVESLGGKAGKYTPSKSLVIRWHKGAELGDHFSNYLAQKHDCTTDETFAEFLRGTTGLEPMDCHNFLGILRKLEKKPLKQSSPFNISADIPAENLTLLKLTITYNENTLSSEEKAQVARVAKICMYSKDIPAAMEKFAKFTLNRYARCKKNDKAKLASFLAETFYQLTEIHPFPNANGRLATLMLNLFLVSFGYPSLLLRYPGENADKTSLYSMAIDKIDESRDFLAKLILIRMNEESPYSNLQLKELFALKVKAKDLLKEIQALAPGFDLELIREKTAAIMQAEIQAKMALHPIETNQIENLEELVDTNEQYIASLTTIISCAEAMLNELREKKSQPKTFLAQPLSFPQSQALCSKLDSLTQVSPWKYSQKDGGCFWLVLDNDNQAAELIGRLQALNCMTVTLKHAVKGNTPIIMLKNIQEARLQTFLAEAQAKKEENSQVPSAHV